jgi:hypothetical protein
MRISPSLIVSSPAIAFSSVDLPQPADQHQEPALLQLQVDTLQHLQPMEALAQAHDLEKRHRPIP